VHEFIRIPATAATYEPTLATVPGLCSCPVQHQLVTAMRIRFHIQLHGHQVVCKPRQARIRGEGLVHMGDKVQRCEGARVRLMFILASAVFNNI